MSNYHKEKFTELLSHSASNFISERANKNSLITVTGISMTPDFLEAKIFVSVFPDSQAESAINFLQKQKQEFREYLKEKTNLHTIPHIDFLIDLGEKSRQRIDELSNNL